MVKNLNSKRIGIFGLGVTGQSIYTYLKNQTSKIICWDDSEKNREAFSQKNLLVNLSSKFWAECDIIFISPGIPQSHEIFLLASLHNIQISSDIELFLHLNLDSKIIAITGTNGKSTTTALAHHILEQSGYEFLVGGNIGTPVLSLPQNKPGYILELSSFQLDLIKFFNPDIAVILNITPDHLDRYKNFDDYCKSKFKILKGDGIKIIGLDSLSTKKIYKNLTKLGEKRIIAISGSKQVNAIGCANNYIYDSVFDVMTYKLHEHKNLSGKNNQENIAAAFAICRSIGVSPDDIIKNISSFPGLKHRMQNIGTLRNITFYNDSKATNTSAAAGALNSIKNIYWLAGGVFKEQNFNYLDKSLNNIKKAYLFGESKLLFSEYLKKKIDYELFDTMQEAFAKAYIEAENNKVDFCNIVLAPACSSLDQFKNFEDRGEQFINLCNEKFK